MAYKLIDIEKFRTEMDKIPYIELRYKLIAYFYLTYPNSDVELLQMLNLTNSSQVAFLIDYIIDFYQNSDNLLHQKPFKQIIDKIKSIAIITKE